MEEHHLVIYMCWLLLYIFNIACPVHAKAIIMLARIEAK